MALHYASKIGLEAVTPVIDEYVVWFGKVMRAFLTQTPMRDLPPQVFSEWLKTSDLPPEISARIYNIHRALIGTANDFAENPAKRTPEITLRLFDDLNGHFEQFVHFMHRLEVDTAIENSGFDQKTGLRSVKLMKADLKQELDRLSRRGDPFSIILVKINNFKEEWRGHPETIKDMIDQVSNHIKASLRSFDDAYYLGDEYFLLSLKHTDLVGGQSAIRRLNAFMAQTPVLLTGSDEEEVYVGSVLYSPEPGDDIDNMISMMKLDLENINEKGTVLQYNNMSPLQRFLQSTEKGK